MVQIFQVLHLSSVTFCPQIQKKNPELWWQWRQKMLKEDSIPYFPTQDPLHFDGLTGMGSPLEVLEDMKWDTGVLESTEW